MMTSCYRRAKVWGCPLFLLLVGYWLFSQRTCSTYVGRLIFCVAVANSSNHAHGYDRLYMDGSGKSGDPRPGDPANGSRSRAADDTSDWSGSFYPVPVERSGEQSRNGSADSEGPQSVPRSCQNTYQTPGTGFTIVDDPTEYNLHVEGKLCLSEGTSTVVAGLCRCRSGWQGPQCSVPDVVVGKGASFPASWKPKLLAKPRRLFVALPVNMEVSLLEARFAETADIVDVFLILESNYTLFGDPKRLEIRDRLVNGQFQNARCKILYVFLDYFPEGGKANGWIPMALSQNYIGIQGVDRQLRGYRDDDVFVLNDADELPKREVLLFLKMHEGYPFPILFEYQTNIFGFFWKKPASTSLPTAFNMEFLKECLNGLPYAMRSMGYRKFGILRASNLRQLSKYNIWTIGSKTNPAGWHCSWCFDPEGIRNKLISAINADKPRWGDYPDKLDLNYLAGLIKKGHWFDKPVQILTPVIFNSTKDFAPPYMVRNKERYAYLLVNPYIKVD